MSPPRPEIFISATSADLGRSHCGEGSEYMLGIDIWTVVLIVWSLGLLGVVTGVFVGVLYPGVGAAHGVSRGLRQTAVFLAHKRVWMVVGVLGAGLMFGTASAYIVTGAPGGQAAYGQGSVGQFVDMLYEGVREITWEATPTADQPLVSRLGRTAGLAAMLLLAFEVIVKLFQEPVQRLRLRFYRNHVVICGLGRIGRELTKACCEVGERVVVVERSAENVAIPAAQEHGALVWVGDSTRKSVLRLVGAGRARHVFFVSGSDEQNLEAAYNLLAVLEEQEQGASEANPGGRPALLKVSMHLDRPALDAIVVYMKRQQDATASTHLSNALPKRLRSGGIEWRSFNAADRSIQDLFDTHILERRPLRPALRGDVETRQAGAAFEVAHFVIIGFGDVGQRLALHLAELSHFENLRRSRMTIVYGPEEEGALKRFKQERSALFPTRTIVQEAAAELQQRDPSAAAEFADYDPSAADNAWMPDPRLDRWEFGVHVQDAQNPADTDRGVRFVCNGGFVLDPAGTTSPQLVERLVDLSSEPTVRPMVFICNADDEDNCLRAVQLRDELDMRLKQSGQARQDRDHAITIFPFVPNRPMLTALTAPTDPFSADLIPFGDCSISCTYDKLTTDPVAQIAQAIASDFLQQQGGAASNAPSGVGMPKTHSAAPPPAASGSGVPTWEQLRPWERYSNLSAAMHINAKLRVLDLCLIPASEAEARKKAGYHTVEPTGYDSVSLRQRIIIARMEHNRWMAERLLAGWSLGRRNPSDASENKRRHHFVPWSMLASKAERNKDHSQVAAALRVCRNLIAQSAKRPPHEKLVMLSLKPH